MNFYCNYKWIFIVIVILYRFFVLVMNKNKFLVWFKWINEKDIGMFGVWIYWRKRIIKKRNLSIVGFFFFRKKKRFVIGLLVLYIFYFKVNWVILFLRIVLWFKKNDKIYVCCIMFKIYNFKILSSFNLLLNKRGGGYEYEFLW